MFRATAHGRLIYVWSSGPWTEPYGRLEASERTDMNYVTERRRVRERIITAEVMKLEQRQRAINSTRRRGGRSDRSTGRGAARA